VLACGPTAGTAYPEEGAAAGAEAAAGGFAYPDTETGDVVDDYHGTKVADPYRWLEDTDSDKTAAWVKAQNEVTFAYLEQIPERDALRKRLTQLWNYERFGLPHKEGKRYFVSRNDGLQNQSVLYTMDALDGDMKLLLDPNTLSADGTVALSGTKVSHDGKLMAYGLSASGSDWQTWRVRDVETGKDLDDELKWIKFSGASWTKDDKGFFYSRYDEPENKGKQYEDTNFYNKLYYHRLGDPQAKDELIYERKDHKEWGFNGYVTEDGRYLMIRVRQGTERKNAYFYRDLRKKKGEIVELLNEFDASYGLVGNKGPVFWFRTDLDAPRGRVIAIDLRKPARDEWKVIIPEAKETLRGVSAVGNRFIASYLKDAKSQVKVFDLKGKLEREVKLPGIATAYGFRGKLKDKETFYSFSNYYTPGTIYRYDIAKGESEVFKAPKVGFNPDDYTTEQVFYESKDGTTVPMFISHRKDLERDGNTPTYLYAYGGFNAAITPRFNVPDLVWMEMGGILAIPNLRGGGEYGEEWHQAGMKLNKQNVFDDFIAAAEWLMKKGYTTKDKIAIGGRSNGGLLVGAAMTQRPDLFKAALPGVGVMDMLRFHKFTIGWAWVSDYGSAENPEEFKALHAYSPYHNLEKGTDYPATLVYTADHDRRRTPAPTRS
jgi:prolyl oligopeptidase